MSSGRRDDERPASRWHRQRAWAACILLLGLLLLVWPFVRTPPLTLGLTFAHLLGAWAAAIVALFGMSLELGRHGRGGGDG
jgi:hypothetical protein